ncbi:MAG: membrane protein insertase YidC [Gammaproteobacteria bacterium]
MDNIRIILIVALGFVLFQLWERWQEFSRPSQQAVAGSVQAPVAAVPPQDMPNVPEKAEAPKDGKVQENVLASEKRIKVKTDVMEVVIDTLGGDIRRVTLPSYPVDIDQPNQPFVLMQEDPPFFIAQGGLLSGQKAPTHETAYTASNTDHQLDPGKETLEVVLSWSEDGISVKKIFTFRRGEYLVGVRYEIDNASSQAWGGHLYQQLQRHQAVRSTGFVQAFTGVALSNPERRYEKFDSDDLSEEAVAIDAKGGWAAMLQHYFLAALVPDQNSLHHYYAKLVPKNNSYLVGLTGPGVDIAAGEKRTLSMQLFLGPKMQKRLEHIAPHLELTADYGPLWFIAKPLFWLLDKIHFYLGNWGWSIVVITLIVKGVFYRLAAASYRSIANMKRLQPRLLAIKERHGDDRGKMNQAMMELYKKEKINPLGGCLPVVVQIPVWIALYWVLMESVELRQAPFMFWIRDLSLPDPFYFLPLLMGVTMYAQQKLNPTPVDPVQEKVFQLFPIVFTVMSTFFAAGLVLYWVVNSVLSILQQWMITRSIEGAQTAKA